MGYHCQTNEYEVIAKYLALIGRLDRPTFIDIGAGDGYRLSNVRDLIERHGATGLMIDGDNHGNAEVVQAWITKENIVELCKDHPNPDFLSIDIDGNDFWVLGEYLDAYRPALIMAEINPRFRNAQDSFAVPYYPQRTWQNDDHFGMSFGAFDHLVHGHKYTVVHMEGINALAMRSRLVTHDTPIHIDYRHQHGHKANPTAPWIPV